MTLDIITPLPLLQGDGGDAMEPARWFSTFLLGLPTGWDDGQWIECFKLQLDPGNVAQEWFDALPSSDTATLKALQLAFSDRWPATANVQLSWRQQK